MRSLSFTIKTRLKAFISGLPFFDKMYSQLLREDLNTYPADVKVQPLSPCPVEHIISVTFPPHYWLPGPHILEYGHPWLSPGAVMYLVNHLKPSFKVLEIGSGGSTVFFALRCSSVVSIESYGDWFKSVTDELAKRNLHNVEMVLKVDQTAIEEFVKSRATAEFDCILVDPMTGFDRSNLVRLCRPKLKEGGLLIIDNFAVVNGGTHMEMRPPWWHSNYYVDPHWSGRGTSIHIKMPQG